MIKFVTLACLVAFACGGSIPQADGGMQEFIVGGKDTDISKVPFMIALLKSGNFSCSGSIVSPTVIVTAAHCLYAQKPQIFSVRAGSSDANSSGVIVGVRDYHIHPKYYPFGYDYEIAVVVLEKRLNYSKTIQPIALGTREPRKNTIVKSIGYGALYEDGPNAKTLQSVLIPIVPRPTCVQNYASYSNITSRMICAGVEGKGSCQGDNGGPLVQSKKLVGVVFAGRGCARKGSPGIYTNVADPEINSFLRKFIKN